MKKNSQNYRLIKYLLWRKSITPLECYAKLGFLQPARRIHDIRELFGEDVITTKIITKNDRTHARYSLNKDRVKEVREYIKKI